MLRQCNNFLICVGVLLSLSCLVFTLAYASEFKKESIVAINNKTGTAAERPIQSQQREMKNSLKRMEQKIRKRKKRRQRKKINNVL
jgi:hypothetical protein